MSGEKVVRYTAEDFALESSSNTDISKKVSAMLWQAAQTEADVAGLVEALNSVMRMDVRGHQLQDRLQFSDPGRAILNCVNEALARFQP